MDLNKLITWATVAIGIVIIVTNNLMDYYKNYAENQNVVILASFLIVVGVILNRKMIKNLR